MGIGAEQPRTRTGEVSGVGRSDRKVHDHGAARWHREVRAPDGWAWRSAVRGGRRHAGPRAAGAHPAAERRFDAGESDSQRIADPVHSPWIAGGDFTGWV